MRGMFLFCVKIKVIEKYELRICICGVRDSLLRSMTIKKRFLLYRACIRGITFLRNSIGTI